MKLEDQISINKFGQGLIMMDYFLDLFLTLSLIDRRTFLRDLIILINQSKSKKDDIEIAIKESGLKPTFTPCVLLSKGIAEHHLQKITELPEAELAKSLVLLLNLFKVSYKRRFEVEKNHPDKWWYWDLSTAENIKKILHKS